MLITIKKYGRVFFFWKIFQLFFKKTGHVRNTRTWASEIFSIKYNLNGNAIRHNIKNIESHTLQIKILHKQMTLFMKLLSCKINLENKKILMCLFCWPEKNWRTINICKQQCPWGKYTIFSIMIPFAFLFLKFWGGKCNFTLFPWRPWKKNNFYLLLFLYAFVNFQQIAHSLLRLILVLLLFFWKISFKIFLPPFNLLWSCSWKRRGFFLIPKTKSETQFRFQLKRRGGG